MNDTLSVVALLIVLPIGKIILTINSIQTESYPIGVFQVHRDSSKVV